MIRYSTKLPEKESSFIKVRITVYQGSALTGYVYKWPALFNINPLICAIEMAVLLEKEPISATRQHFNCKSEHFCHCPTT